MFDVLPLRVIPPLIMGIIIYPMVGLVSDRPEFYSFLFVLVLFNLTTASLCLLIGILCSDSSVASLLGSLIMLFGLLFSGPLLNNGMAHLFYSTCTDTLQRRYLQHCTGYNDCQFSTTPSRRFWSTKYVISH